MNKQASVSDIVKILDHDRAVVTWVVRPILTPAGTPGIERLTRIAVIYPKDVVATAEKKPIKQYIGTGPYKFAERNPGRFI